VIGLEPLKRFVSRVTDNIFYKAKIDYQDVLQEISEVINREIELNSLITSVDTTLKSRLKISYSAIALADEQGNFSEFGNHDGALAPIKLPANSSVLRYLKREGKITILESLERKIQDTSDPAKLKELEQSRDEMEGMHAALAGPIVAQGKFNAVLILGPKLSGDTFSGEELKLFAALTPQIGSAIEKSTLYEEVKGFTNQLKAKVEEATVELKERNRALIALQRVTGLITRTLDYKNALQQIANNVSTELGYIGGVIMLKDPNSAKTYLGAVTETPLTRQAFKLLPGPVLELSGSINDQDLSSKAMRTGESQISEKLEEFISPPVPGLIAKGIQKLVRAKTIVAEPIYTENEVIGTLVYLIDRDRVSLKQREFEVMRSIADQTGITIRTLRYIDQIKKVNADLEEANVHLRQLDQAKSEFVSIASHQLRTPMTGIMGYLSMMVEGDFGKMAPEHKKLLEELLSESQRMIRLINLFLNVSKIESGKLTLTKQPTQIADLIDRQIKDQIKPAETKGLVLKYEAPKESLPIVEADSDKLMNVIQNLIDNAIKYTERGSVTVRAFRTDHRIQVEVHDTGVGIKREDVGELFRKFVRGSGIAQINPDGSGLGLFIAKSIVEMHGGNIWVSSEGEGKGSTFAFTIPVK
jgi:signal transduction histidine kinase